MSSRTIITILLSAVCILAVAGAAEAQDPSTRATCGEYGAAGQVAACRQYLATDPDADFDWGLRNLVNAYLSVEDYPAAVQAADRFATVADNGVEALAYRCLTRGIAGMELEIAAAACDEAIRNGAPESVVTARGIVRLKQGRFEDAWRDFSLVARTGEEVSAQPLYGRALAGLHLGYEGAERDMAEALAIEPDVGQLFARWGMRPPGGPANSGAASDTARTSAGLSAPAAASDLAYPVWVRSPQATESDYPEQARRNNIQGDAALRCGVRDDGRLADCRVVAETPEGYGFADGAAQAARRARIDPQSLVNEAPDRTVLVRVRFRL